MASDPERLPEAEETLVLGPDEPAPASDDWPVADLYRVEAETEPPNQLSPTAEVLDDEAPPTQRRFPPDVGTRALIAIATTIGALAIGAILLSARADDESGSTSAPASAAGLPSENGDPSTPTTPALSENPREVRDLAGLSLAEARSALEELGLAVRVVRVDSGERAGRVVRQTPRAGVALGRGEVVVLFISRGQREARSQIVSVPDVVGRSSSHAVVAVREVGLVPRIRLVDSSERAGTVLRQSPQDGSNVPEGETIQLFVARSRPAPRFVSVPDVRGLDAGDARSRIRSAGLVAAIERVRAAEPAGTVVGQSPVAGAELRNGGVVTLTVSTGPARVDVPDVTGLDEDSARLELESAGFVVRVTDESTADPSQDGIVMSQTPAGGSSAQEGAAVMLVVARFD